MTGLPHVLIDRTLGHYHITAELGAGGMGEVYRATDMTLGREVAIKVLPANVAADPDRVARFRREARLLASLNHPNIAAIYGFEETEGAAFLTLELIEGEDLAARLRRGPVPLLEAIEIAKQIAEALEAAHERGIIHRDLKPANVKVTPSGTAKVLDFGLAKAWAGDNTSGVSSPNPSLSPTFVGSETAAGMILGTAAYMSPEQARGRVVDRRADVWAFGVVLYEMLTGRAPFGGETLTDVIAAVVRAEPDLSALPPETPPAVRRLLRRCLQKDARLRLPDVGAARVELSEILAGVIDVENAGAAWSPRLATWLVAAAVLAVVAAGAGYLTAHRATGAPARLPLVHATLQTPASFRLGQYSMPVISPDGQHIVISAITEGRQMLWIRRLDSLAFEPLEGTDGASMPFWSPDSRHVAFVSDRQLKSVSLDGGIRTIAILDSGFFGGGTWNAGGLIVLSKGERERREPAGATLVQVQASGGTVEPLTTLDAARGEYGHFWPQFFRDGRRLAFAAGSSNPEHDGIAVTAIDTPQERHLLLPDRSRPAFTPGGVLFVRGNQLVAQPFDEESLRVDAEPRVIAQNVGAFEEAGLGLFSTSAAGMIVYAGLVPVETRLSWVTRTGVRQGDIGPLLPYGQIALSPDDRRVAVELQDAKGEYDIWVLDVARGVPTRLTFSRGNDRDPVWSPDGSRIIFGSDREGIIALFRKDLARSDPEARLFETTQSVYPESWTPDGEAIVYQDAGMSDKGRTGWRWRLDGSRAAEAILKTGFSVDELQVSPDGRLLAYISAESGRYDVYIETLTGPKTKVRVSMNGGGQPKWRRDGRELFFVAGGRLHAVAVSRGADLEVGLPVPLFELTDTGEDFDDYAPSADGQRFLVKVRAGEAVSPPLQLLMNWERVLVAPHAR